MVNSPGKFFFFYWLVKEQYPDEWKECRDLEWAYSSCPHSIFSARKKKELHNEWITYVRQTMLPLYVKEVKKIFDKYCSALGRTETQKRMKEQFEAEMWGSMWPGRQYIKPEMYKAIGLEYKED